MTVLVLVGAVTLAVWLYLLSARGGYWRERIAAPVAELAVWPEIVAVVPARDEAASIPAVVCSLLAQDYPGRFRLVVVDDHSEDGTAALARDAAERLGAGDRLSVVPARALPDGWTGKLWAVAEGLAHAEAMMGTAPYALLTDADVVHAPTNLKELVARAERGRLDLVSLMVRLNCRTLAERALIPAFVYFFQMLYPFGWVNNGDRRTAAAAGGCMLVRRSALQRIGGIARIRGALIDDCALAEAIKDEGDVWLGLADRTLSLRVYPRFGDIERMVARSAYTQLRRSPALLALAVGGMALVFLAPPLLAFIGAVMADGAPLSLMGMAAWVMMAGSFAPTLRYYGVSLLWAPMLPAIALFYLGATLHSAYQYRLGRGGEWKGRIQARESR